MRIAILLLCAFLASCTQPPMARETDPCPPLPKPLGNTIAAQRAYTLLVIQLYAQCASSKD